MKHLCTLVTLLLGSLSLYGQAYDLSTEIFDAGRGAPFVSHIGDKHIMFFAGSPNSRPTVAYEITTSGQTKQVNFSTTIPSWRISSIYSTRAVSDDRHHAIVSVDLDTSTTMLIALVELDASLAVTTVLAYQEVAPGFEMVLISPQPQQYDDGTIYWLPLFYYPGFSDPTIVQFVEYEDHITTKMQVLPGKAFLRSRPILDRANDRILVSLLQDFHELSLDLDLLHTYQISLQLPSVRSSFPCDPAFLSSDGAVWCYRKDRSAFVARVPDSLYMFRLTLQDGVMPSYTEEDLVPVDYRIADIKTETDFDGLGYTIFVHDTLSGLDYGAGGSRVDVRHRGQQYSWLSSVYDQEGVFDVSYHDGYYFISGLAYRGQIWEHVFYHILSEDSPLLTGTGEVDATLDDHSIRLVPNPADDYLDIETGETLLGYTICDMSGRELVRSSGAETHVDISALPAGTYVVTAVTQDGYRYSELLLVYR